MPILGTSTLMPTLPTDMPTITLARGLLMLMLMPMPTTDSTVVDTMATPMLTEATATLMLTDTGNLSTLGFYNNFLLYL